MNDTIRLQTTSLYHRVSDYLVGLGWLPIAGALLTATWAAPARGQAADPAPAATALTVAPVRLEDEPTTPPDAATDATAPAAPAVAPATAAPPARIATATPSSSPLAAPLEGLRAGTDGPAVYMVTDTDRLPVSVLLNKGAVLKTRSLCKRVAVGQPDVADINVLDPHTLLLTGKRPGSTQLIIWNDKDKAEEIDITVALDLAGVQEQIKTLFPSLKLDVRGLNGTVALSGHVPSLAVAEQVLQVAKSYAPTITDLLEISGGQQVMLQVRFAEVSRTATSALGVNLGLSDGKSFGASNIGGVNPFGAAAGTGAGGSSAQNLLPSSPGAAVTLFGQGAIGKSTLSYFVEALRQNDLLRILAEPNVMAISGQEASFIAGGEFPIPVTQGGAGGGAALTIEYREYGVKLKFVPVVMGDGRIRLKVSPEVSDLDYANGVTIGGFRIPGITQRKVSTTVELVDGQTFAVAGLLSSSVTAGKEVTPLLGDLPVIGALFRSVRYARSETELVVLVTPRLVEPMNPGEVPALPGEYWRHPSENELFMDGFLGKETGDPRRIPTTAAHNHTTKGRAAPRFYGPYGFAPVGEATPPPAALANVRD